VVHQRSLYGVESRVVGATARGRVMPLTSRLSGQLGVAERQSEPWSTT